MSLKTVQSIVGRLMTDEEFRLRFLSDPLDVLNALRDQGVDLTTGEIEALLRSPVQAGSSTTPFQSLVFEIVTAPVIVSIMTTPQGISRSCRTSLSPSPSAARKR